MTNSNYIHIAAVVDRSGSMRGVANDMVGGLNQFFADQAKLPGTCLVDYVQFSNEYELVFENCPVADAKAQLQPRGMTALLDAVGTTIINLGNKFRDMPEEDRPGKVLIVIVTDGYENSSKEFTRTGVKQLIEHQTSQYNWEFVFLGANMDAVKVGDSYGISMSNSLTYDIDNIAVAAASVSAYATNFRGGGQTGFTEADRKANAPKRSRA